MHNRLLHDFHRVFSQQFQDANVLARPGHRAVTSLELLPQLLEASRQYPAVKHEGMIQGRRSATENGQIMTRFYNPFSAGVASTVAGDSPLG